MKRIRSHACKAEIKRLRRDCPYILYEEIARVRSQANKDISEKEAIEALIKYNGDVAQSVLSINS